MQLVATLIAPQPDSELADFAHHAASALQADAVQTVQNAQAYDLFFSTGDERTLREKCYSCIAQHAFDVIVQPVAGRKKNFLVADMESTIIQQEMLDEMAQQCGFHDRVADITLRAMNGELDFQAALEARVALFAGQPVQLLEDMAQRITLMGGAEALLKAMKAQGVTCWLVSGGFTYFTAPVAQQLGFNAHYANTLLLQNNKIAGTVMPPVLDRAAKKMHWQRGLQELGLSPAESLTVGDGMNDIDMLTACTEGGGLGIAFHPKPAVAALATHIIRHADLSALLFAQGIAV